MINLLQQLSDPFAMPFDTEEKEDFSLGPEQVEALDRIKHFLEGTQPVFVLKGSAGTGKSLLINYIIKHLKNIGIKYCLCAPTHKAALVIERYTHTKAKTLHSLLAMSPKLDILRLNFRELQFNSKECKEIPYDGVVICDEASMINDDLFDFLCKRCKEFNTQLICVMDNCQLQPVKQKTKSKVDSVKNQYTLTKIYRQDKESALTDILIDLRIKPALNFSTKYCELGNLICNTNIKEFLKPAVELYRKTVSTKDILQTKILAYTNKRVDQYNNFFHRNIFKNNNQYNQYEFLTCYCNLNRDCMEFWNSMDYVITEKPVMIDINIPKFGVVPGFSLMLYDNLNRQTGHIKIIDKTFDNFKQLASVIEGLRMDAIYEEKPYKKRLCWKDYFKTTDSFVSPIDLMFDGRIILKKGFDYGYATTVHRSQGSTINTVFVDMEDIFKQKNTEELRQLQYVALSRTRKDAYLFL